MRYEVFLNGKRECTAGLAYGVLTAGLTWVKRNPERFERNGGRFRDVEHYCEESAYLDVGGLDLTTDDEDRNVQWLRTSLKPGDVIEIRILEPGGEVDAATVTKTGG